VLGVLRTLGRQSAAERADRRLTAREASAFRAQASVGTFHLDVHDIVANDDHAVALVTSHQEVGGVKYEDLGSHVVHMQHGKVTESWFFAWNPYQQDELFPGLTSRPRPSRNREEPRVPPGCPVPRGGTSHAPARNKYP
jgi:hypothetical protein